MNQLLAIIIMAAAVATSPTQAEDLFSRAEQANRDFWRRGESALWTANAPDRSALTEIFLSDDHEEEDEHGVDYRIADCEADYRDCLCAGMDREVTLPSGARADCLSDTHAIEVDFTERWAKALGQALSYAGSTGLKPGIFLVCRQAPRNCLRHRLRLDETIAAWSLPIVVWDRDG
ncbi:MAG: hypothetical protein ACR2RF_10565 [Geminicoccaceae bacterium]